MRVFVAVEWHHQNEQMASKNEKRNKVELRKKYFLNCEGSNFNFGNFVCQN